MIGVDGDGSWGVDILLRLGEGIDVKAASQNKIHPQLSKTGPIRTSWMSLNIEFFPYSGSLFPRKTCQSYKKPMDRTKGKNFYPRLNWFSRSAFPRERTPKCWKLCCFYLKKI